MFNSAWRIWLKLLTAFGMLVLLAGALQAQTIYGIGGTAASGLFNNIYIIDPTTGASTTPSVPSSIAPATSSAALGVSPINGLVYFFSRTVPAQLFTWNPSNGVVTLIGTSGTPAAETNLIRSTFCPDGKLYVSGNGAGGGVGAEIYEINPATGALIRTITLSNLPTNGSGDIVCTTNGDLYAIAAETNLATSNIQLYRVPEASWNANTGTFTVAGTLQGNSNLTATVLFNGVSERPDGSLIGTAVNNASGTYAITTTNFTVSTLTLASLAQFADLGRSFPLGISFSKSQTPTTLVQGTQTVTYTIVVNNPGPSVVGNVTVTDVLPSAFSNVNWVCGVSNTGRTNTAITTACGAASGTGNLNTNARLSIGGQIRYTITAVLGSTFTGTLSNSVTGGLDSNLTVLTPTATVSTVTASVQPAANLSVTKTNGATTTVAGTTVNYTITFSNFGPGAANNAVIQDVPSVGLQNCSVVSCTGAGAPTAATCPATPTLILSPTTSTIPTFPANSSVTFVVRCGVSATGQ